MNCGECTLCCSMLKVRMAPVHDYLKPERTSCQYECKNGCSIYNSKPEACSVFKCVWLGTQDLPIHLRLDPSLRPDRCGIVLEFNNENAITAHMSDGHINEPKYTELRRILFLLISKGLTILIHSASCCSRLELDGSLTDLVEVGVHPETGNIVFMTRVNYDALSKDVKTNFKQLYNLS